MPENKVPAHSNRPRLLSDIRENPLFESAIPEEYNMQRPSLSPARQSSSHPRKDQGDFYRYQYGSRQQVEIGVDPLTVSAPGPGIIGQPLQQTLSGNLVPQGERLQPLTPNDSQLPPRCNETRRSAPTITVPIFAVSSDASEPISPTPAQTAHFKRSFSNTSLASGRKNSRSRTPTPTSGGVKGRGKYGLGSSSLPSSPKLRNATPHPHGKPSVKHLTCFWWKVKGVCRFSEDDCLYAHRDTGLLADAPRQVVPGEPAKAGRHLEKAMEQLHPKRNLSTSSLNTSMLANPSSPESQDIISRATSPWEIESIQERLSSLKSDNQFLRSLVEQSNKERSVLMTTIESLQKENSNLNKDVDFLKDVVDELQQQRRLPGGVTPRNLSPMAKDHVQPQ